MDCVKRRLYHDPAEVASVQALKERHQQGKSGNRVLFLLHVVYIEDFSLYDLLAAPLTNSPPLPKPKDFKAKAKASNGQRSTRMC